MAEDEERAAPRTRPQPAGRRPRREDLRGPPLHRRVHGAARPD